jgi:hypothetical protein
VSGRGGKHEPRRGGGRREPHTYGREGVEAMAGGQYEASSFCPSTVPSLPSDTLGTTGVKATAMAAEDGWDRAHDGREWCGSDSGERGIPCPSDGGLGSVGNYDAFSVRDPVRRRARSRGREGEITFPVGPTRTSCNKHILGGLVASNPI